MVEQSGVVIKSEQERTDFFVTRPVTEAANRAVGGAALLDLDHRSLARRVGLGEALGDDA